MRRNYALAKNTRTQRAKREEEKKKKERRRRKKKKKCACTCTDVTTEYPIRGHSRYVCMMYIRRKRREGATARREKRVGRKRRNARVDSRACARGVLTQSLYSGVVDTSARRPPSPV